MRKRIALFAAVMTFAASFSGAAFAAAGDNPGHPDENPAGKCPAGQNKDTSPGGLKKCG
jgi:hypothetical protein